MSTEDVVRRGYMTVCPPISEAMSRTRILESVLRKLAGQKLWYVLRNHSLRGRARLEFYKDEKSGSDSSLLKGFIPLAEMTNAYVKDGESKKLLVECTDTVHVFRCASMAEAEDWLEALVKVAPEKMPGSSDVKATNKRVQTWAASSKATDGRFIVTVPPYTKLKFVGQCEMIVNEWDIYLKDLKTNQYIEAFPLCFIRKYGSGPDHFTIETGRRCNTGEGVFRFKTSSREAAELYQLVHQNSENLAKSGLMSSNTPISQDHTSPTRAPDRPKAKSASHYADLNPSTVNTARLYEPLQQTSSSLPTSASGQGYMSLQQVGRDKKTDSSQGQYMPLK